MSDINIKQLQRLRLRMQILENLTLAGTIGVGVALYLHKQEWTYGLIIALILLFVYKYYTRIHLRKREFLSNIVEQRTMELRYQRDQIQAESQKLEQALTALAEAQDELVRKERLASVGQLTQGLVDRILNPLNYINNFAGLSVSLVDDLEAIRQEDLEKGRLTHTEDSEEALTLLRSNLDKIAKHGASTVRIVKAMEELLKDRSGNRCAVEINELCKIHVELMRKNHREHIERYHIQTSFYGLSTPLTLTVNVDQLGKAFMHIFNNSFYAVIKKAESLASAGENTPAVSATAAVSYQPEIIFVLRIVDDKLQLRIRDNGTGIEEGIQKKVFSPFFTTKPTGEAAGTGLYMSREVILNHKGTIEIESKKGDYTEVIISLPIYQ